MPISARALCATAVCAVISSLPQVARAGDPTLMIDRIEDQPIAVERGEFAPKDPEWLRTLAIHVRNTSGKAINYVEFTVSLSGLEGETVDSRLEFMASETSHSSADKPIAPDKSAKIQWSGDAYKALKRQLASGKIFYPAAAVFRLHSVGFADGTVWIDGRK